MEIKRSFSRIIPLISVLLIIITSFFIFVFRAPVLIVTDPSFNLLYGTSRARMKQAELSARHFYRVVSVTVRESAGAEFAVEAVNAASIIPVINMKIMPRAVFFSGLFSSAAQKFSDEWPDIPVIIIEPRDNRTSETVRSLSYPVTICADSQTDLFNAGICAGYLVQGESGRVLVYQTQNLSPALREAFEIGLRSQGYAEAPVYVLSTADFAGWPTISTVVVTGSSSRYFDLNQRIPSILFSWIDPILTPENIKAVFDDSPWAMVSKALKILDSNSVRSPQIWENFPSEIITPANRINEDRNFMEKLVYKYRDIL